jgi:5-methylcytosine-specific restriction endonuclease McrA
MQGRTQRADILLMPRLTARPCRQRYCPHTATRLGLCPTHAALSDKVQRRTVPTKVREPSDRARRKAVVRMHVRTHGYVCPGYGVEPHPSHDLTADHVVPVYVDTHGSGTLSVLCRSCNSRKNNQTNKE